LGEGDEILVPAWQHGSELEAIERAGCRPILYDVDRTTTSPDAGQIDELITDRTRALYLIHYLGWSHDASRWKRWCDERGLHLIEDCAQGFLSKHEGIPLGSTGSMSIFCIYKTVGVPDGSLLHCAVPAELDPAAARAGWRNALRGNAEWLLQSRNLVAFLRGPRPEGPRGDGDFALGDPLRPALRASSSLIPRLMRNEIVERRASNFRKLAERLGELTPPSFRNLPQGTSPLVYPIAVKDKQSYLQRLGRMGVSALNLWWVPHPRISASDTPDAHWLREHLVGLPVHQELKDHHIEHIAWAALWAAED
jgi:dTDP-4-amino-4,6-dideoxygalactose transaminase